ncbi:MAG TPA: UvrD-helicase domain-containing protein, partial [Thermogutta sp.]|nr:UvrD-helicase domain-containing protein [Thermogutta sp.]
MRASIQEVILGPLNPQQREAVQHGEQPLLIVAGAGTGKTATIVHRVAWLVAHGVSPQSIMLLTFTRRAAEEMIRRASSLLSRLGLSRESTHTSHIWGGT